MCNVKNGPGKFEGEACYAEELYSLWNSGQLDESEDYTDGILRFETDDEFDIEFKKRHNIGAEVKSIQIYEDELGFVYCTECVEEF